MEQWRFGEEARQRKEGGGGTERLGEALGEWKEGGGLESKIFDAPRRKKNTIKEMDFEATMISSKKPKVRLKKIKEENLGRTEN